MTRQGRASTVGESLGGEQNPRKEQWCRSAATCRTTRDWTRRWSNTLKSAGRRARARDDGRRGFDGHRSGTCGAASSPEHHRTHECSVPPGRSRKAHAGENGGRAVPETSTDRGASGHPTPRERGGRRPPAMADAPTGGAGEPDSHQPPGAIRAGERHREVDQEPGSTPQLEQTRKGTPTAGSSTRCRDVRARGTGEPVLRRGGRLPEERSPGPPLRRGRKAPDDGDGATRAAHGTAERRGRRIEARDDTER